MISFSIRGVPVDVRPSFWIIAVLLGLGLGEPAMVAVWVAVVFVSVLAHELGHAFTARHFGAEVAITLTTLGGLTSWQAPQGQVPPGRRALVAAAGSAVGIVLGLVVLGVYLLVDPSGPRIAEVVNLVVWVNVGWGVLNWLPIRPLDGGHLLVSLLEIVAPRRATGIANVVFLVTSVAALAAALYYGFVFVAILAAFMAWSEISARLGSPAPRASEPIEFSYDADDAVEADDAGGTDDPDEPERDEPVNG